MYKLIFINTSILYVFYTVTPDELRRVNYATDPSRDQSKQLGMSLSGTMIGGQTLDPKAMANAAAAADALGAPPVGLSMK